MADVNAEIGVNIDTSGALAQLKSLQREIARFHASVAKSSDQAALAQRDLQKNFINGVNAIQGFSAELRTVKTTAESFTDSLERNKFSMREYFRYSMASTKTFGRAFRSELDTVNKVAVENVKRLQTQYIKMGRDANGAMKAIAVMPTKLDMTNLSTQTQLASQRQAIFNQLVKQGSTNLLNFGKNTQWAGRQLMVGFTLPLAGLGAVAARTFMDMETAAIKFKKVYGDLFTAPEETQFALESIQMLGQEFTKYGIAVADTVSLAAEAAAAGFAGADLQAQVAQATRLQVLGQVDQQKALETTISLQNAFRISSVELADAINFLNAVENQTVLSLDDVTTAIPKAAPIVRELGGDVKDLAFFMTAMKEGGINASEGANALKSGLASLINPTDKAKGMLNDMGIDIDRIVESNVGNLKATVIEFAQALDGLSNLQRQRAIEQLFGKFQQARLSALFDNVIRDGNQASRVLDLAAYSVEDLASLAEKELGLTADSAMNKFRGSVELLKASLAPVGEVFLQILTPILDKLNNLLQWFNGLSDTSKKVIAKVVFYLGGLAPIILMTIGLMANFVANGIKGLMLLRNGFLRLTGQSQILGEQTQYLTVEQQNAVAAAASLEQSHMKLQQAFTGEAGAVRKLISEYQRMIAAQNMAATRFPGMMQPGFKATGYAKGVVSVPGPKGAGDIIPAMLSPGEAVIPAKMAQKYGGLINGMISDNIPGFEVGLGVETANTPRRTTNPNAMVAAHFADRVQLSESQISELLDREDLPDSVRRAIVAARTAIDPKPIFAYTDAVIALSAQTNQDLKNLTADAGQLRTHLANNMESTHVELIRRLKEAGVPDAEIRAAARRITQNIMNQLPMSGVVGEGSKAVAAGVPDFAQITRNAYAQEASINPNVRTAYDSMLEYATISDAGRRAKGQRVSIPARFRAAIGGLVMRGGSYREKVGKGKTFSNIHREYGGTLSDEYYLTSQAEAITEQAIQRVRDVAQTNSPSRKTIPIGEDIARGLQVGMLNQMDETKAVASQISSAASGLINPRTGKPFTQQEIADLKRVKASDVKGMVAKGIASSDSAETDKKQRARRVATRAQGPAEIGPQAPSGTTMLPIVSPLTAQEKRRERFRSIKGSVAAKATGRFAKAGGGFGASAALFGLSMLPGQLGQLSQAIMPVVFGLQALSFATKLIGGLPVALLAVGAGLFMFNKKINKVAEELDDLAKQEAEARNGSVKSIEQFAEFTGRALPSAREFSRNNRQLISASGEAVKRFAEFYGQPGNRSSQVINTAVMKGQKAGINAAAVDVAQRAAMFGLQPADIAANIKAAADLIGADQVKLTMAVQKILSPDGKDITKEPLSIDARINFLREQAQGKLSAIREDIGKLGGNVGADLGAIKTKGKEDFGTLRFYAGLSETLSRGPLKFLSNIGTLGQASEQYKKVQSAVQSSTTQLSVAFMQESESLALLNSQYADGLITKEQYDAQMNISSENFLSLGESSKSLVEELDKIDGSGKLSAAALKDLGTEAFSALKKSNPALFKKITKSLEDLDSAAQIDIMMGYMQGSLTILDIARLPSLLDEIDGKSVSTAINILTKAGVNTGMLESEIRDRVDEIDRLLNPSPTSGTSLSYNDRRSLQVERKKLAKELKDIEDSKKVIPGATDTDGSSTGKGGGAGDGKFINPYEKEIKLLNKKRDALKEVNDELDRQNQYQMKQMDLINQAAKAKITGDYLQAASLQQQSLLEGARFARESKIVQMDRILAATERRSSVVQDTKKITAADKTFLSKLRAKDYSGIAALPSTPNIGFAAKPGPTGTAGTNIGGAVYNITMNVNGGNPDEVATKVLAKIKTIENKNNKSNKVVR